MAKEKNNIPTEELDNLKENNTGDVENTTEELDNLKEGGKDKPKEKTGGKIYVKSHFKNTSISVQGKSIYFDEKGKAEATAEQLAYLLQIPGYEEV